MTENTAIATAFNSISASLDKGDLLACCRAAADFSAKNPTLVTKLADQFKAARHALPESEKTDSSAPNSASQRNKLYTMERFLKDDKGGQIRYMMHLAGEKPRW